MGKIYKSFFENFVDESETAYRFVDGFQFVDLMSWLIQQDEAAQQSVYLTAFGVGMLAFCAGFVICWLVYSC